MTNRVWSLVLAAQLLFLVGCSHGGSRTLASSGSRKACLAYFQRSYAAPQWNKDWGKGYTDRRVEISKAARSYAYYEMLNKIEMVCDEAKLSSHPTKTEIKTAVCNGLKTEHRASKGDRISMIQAPLDSGNDLLDLVDATHEEVRFREEPRFWEAWEEFCGEQ